MSIESSRPQPVNFSQEQLNLSLIQIYTRLFNLMDQDKNGLLDSNEVKEFLNFFSNATISDQQVQQFISMSDSDKDGNLSFKEIMKILGQ